MEAAEASIFRKDDSALKQTGQSHGRQVGQKDEHGHQTDIVFSEYRI